MQKIKLRYQLTRFGQYYASWGDTPDEIIERETKRAKRPWWWLRLLGWGLAKEVLVGPIYQWPPEQA